MENNNQSQANSLNSFSLSVLVTREEYGEAYAFQRVKRSKNSQLFFLVIGVLLITFGSVGLYFNYAGLAFYLGNSFSVMTAMLGISIIVFAKVLLPIRYRAQGVLEYDRKMDLRFATIYEFKNDNPDEGPKVYINNGLSKGEIPFSFVTKWMETPTFILFSFGREVLCAIPKRLIDEGQHKFILKALAGLKD